MFRRSSFRGLGDRGRRQRGDRSGGSIHRRPLRFEPLEPRRLLALVTVTTDQDVVDFNDGVLSLREAIFASNTVPGADTINFDFGHDGPATILLTQGELRISDHLTIEGYGAALVTIDASGSDPTPDVDDGLGSRIFNIVGGPNGPIDVTIRGVTLTGGDTNQGGAIRNFGNLTILETVVDGNSAIDGGGLYHFTLNAPDGPQSGLLSVVDSTISNNLARVGMGRDPFGGYGGGIFASGEVEITRSVIHDNTARRGGGIESRVSLTITNSTVSGNVAGSGGGISTGLPSIGSGLTRIAHSTITGNTGDGGGGSFNGQATVIEHSIIAANTDGPFGAPGGADLRVTSPLLVVRSSLIGDSTGTPLTEAPVGSPDANGNLIGGLVHGVIDPLIGPLANNGGSTLTHALLDGSPAINRGDLNAVAGQGGVPLYDQRDEPFGRIVGGRIDIGAYEYELPSDLNLFVDTLVDESDGDYSRGDLSLREAIALANANAGHDTIHFDPALTAAGPATILLTTRILTGPNAGSAVAITDSLTINGLGADLLTLDASGSDPTPDVNNGDGGRVFGINDGSALSVKDVTLVGLTLTGGDVLDMGGAIASSENLTVIDSVIRDNFSQNGGGGISASGSVNGAVTILRSTIRDNASRLGGGIRSMAGTLNVVDSIVESNTAIDNGGGIHAMGLSPLFMFISGSTVRNNSAGSNEPYSLSTGGGVFITGQAQATIADSVIEGNSAGSGGGILSGNLIVTNSIISGNVAYRSVGSPALRVLYGGGGIHAVGNLIVTGTTIIGNSSNFSGGGIAASGTGSVLIVNSLVADNDAAHDGGGLRLLSQGNFATVPRHSVTTSTISGNTAGRNGGGIWGFWISGGAMSIVDSTIDGNTAEKGGGLYLRNVTVDQSTISGNTAVIGGGIYDAQNTVVRRSTVAFNSASSVGGGIFVNATGLTLDHTIVARNVGGDQNPGGFNRDLNALFGSVITARYSLVGSGGGSGLTPAPVGSPDANGNLIGGTFSVIGGGLTIDPLLGPLQDNGGPTRTHALLAGSPAINAGDANAQAGVDGVPVHDQRGAPFTRVFGGRIDMGAFESQPVDVLLGDYNGDGYIDSADYTVWRDALGQTVLPGSGADGDGNGVIDTWDLRVWQNNFGTSLNALPTSTGSAALDDGPSETDQFSVIQAPPAAFGGGISDAEDSRKLIPTPAVEQPSTGRSPLSRPSTALRVPDTDRAHIARRPTPETNARYDRLLTTWLAQRSIIRRPPIEQWPVRESESGGQAADDPLDEAFAVLGVADRSLVRGVTT